MLEKSTNLALECALSTGSMTALSIRVASNSLAMELHIAKWISFRQFDDWGRSRKMKLFTAFVFIFTLCRCCSNESKIKKYGEMIIESNYSGAMRKAVMMYEVRIEKKKHENEINTFDFDRWFFSVSTFSGTFSGNKPLSPVPCAYVDMHSRHANYFVHWLWIFFSFLSERDRYTARWFVA